MRLKIDSRNKEVLARLGRELELLAFLQHEILNLRVRKDSRNTA